MCDYLLYHLYAIFDTFLMRYMQVPIYLNVSKLIVHYVPLVILLDEQVSLEPPVESHFYCYISPLLCDIIVCAFIYCIVYYFLGSHFKISSHHFYSKVYIISQVLEFTSDDCTQSTALR